MSGSLLLHKHLMTFHGRVHAARLFTLVGSHNQCDSVLTALSQPHVCDASSMQVLMNIDELFNL